MIAERMVSLLLSIAKILAGVGSRQWNLSRWGYMRITLFKWLIVPVQCLSKYYQYLFVGNFFSPAGLLLGFYSKLVEYTSQ